VCVPRWEELIEPSDFFIRYNRYLAVDMWADSEAHMAQWFGLVESRLRLLVQVRYVDIEIGAYMRAKTFSVHHPPFSHTPNPTHHALENPL
jgi:poly(A) polymerase Pap1